jgi:hypothetical protein
MEMTAAAGLDRYIMYMYSTILDRYVIYVHSFILDRYKSMFGNFNHVIIIHLEIQQRQAHVKRLVNLN